MMTTNQMSNRDKIQTIMLSITLVAIVLMAVFVGDFFDSKDQIYVEGKFYETRYVYKQGTMAFYRYTIDGKSYTNAVKFHINKNKINFDDTYLVKVPEGYPSEGLLLLDSIVK